MGMAATPLFAASASAFSCPVRRLDFFSTSTSPLIRKRTANFQRPLLTGNDYTVFRVSCRSVKVEVEEDDLSDETCELVNGVELSLGEDPHDNFQAQLFKAVKNNNGTGLLLLSDIFGFQDSATRDFAYRVACNGYNVLVPDLFRGDPWSNERPKAMFEEWIAKHDFQRIAKDISTSTKWLVDELDAAGISKKLGIIGFCFGGGRVIDVLAQDEGACFGVGVSFYGTRIDRAIASNVNVPVLLISGDEDLLCRVDVLKDLQKSIGRDSRLLIFQGRGHGFAHRPSCPEEDEDAEQAFAEMRNWLHGGLIENN